MADAATIERISFNQLRGILQRGFEEFLTCMPEGSEAALAMEFEGQDGAPVALSAKERAPLALLADFLEAVRDLRLGGHSAVEVQRLLAEAGVAQAVLSGDGSWYQSFVD